VSSFLTLNGIALQVGTAHLFGRRIAPDWDVSMEIGIRFWRAQFTKAMHMKDIARGRALFDSLLTETDDVYPVRVETSQTPKGLWITPENVKSDITVLYLHGGGYTFNGPISRRFAAMLAHHTKTRLFMPHYRLTPEHPHPAQSDDALAAWQYLRETIEPEKIAVAGDSAGGHMALMLLQTLKTKNLAQPCVCIAICPWTDIGARGESLERNDRYDLVQGWMALKFGDWLDPEGRYGRAALSPITHDFRRLAPIYMQAGGREILRDMIVDFAKQKSAEGADIMLDLWPDMPHNFPAYDSTKTSSSDALERLGQLIESATIDTQPTLPTVNTTRFAAGIFDPHFERKG
jgi:acetyl esterase/lipase